MASKTISLMEPMNEQLFEDICSVKKVDNPLDDSILKRKSIEQTTVETHQCHATAENERIQCTSDNRLCDFNGNIQMKSIEPTSPANVECERLRLECRLLRDLTKSLKNDNENLKMVNEILQRNYDMLKERLETVESEHRHRLAQLDNVNRMLNRSLRIPCRDKRAQSDQQDEFSKYLPDNKRRKIDADNENVKRRPSGSLKTECRSGKEQLDEEEPGELSDSDANNSDTNEMEDFDHSDVKDSDLSGTGNFDRSNSHDSDDDGSDSDSDIEIIETASIEPIVIDSNDSSQETSQDSIDADGHFMKPLSQYAIVARPSNAFQSLTSKLDETKRILAVKELQTMSFLRGCLIEIRDLEQEVASREGTIVSLKSENARLTDELNDVKELAKKREVEISLLKTALQLSNMKSERMDGNNKLLKCELDFAINEMVKLPETLNEYMEFRRQSQSSKRELEELRQDYRRIQAEKQSLSDELTNQTDDIGRLKCMIKNLEETNRELKSYQRMPSRVATVDASAQISSSDFEPNEFDQSHSKKRRLDEQVGDETAEREMRIDSPHPCSDRTPSRDVSTPSQSPFHSPPGSPADYNSTTVIEHQNISDDSNVEFLGYPTPSKGERTIINDRRMEIEEIESRSRNEPTTDGNNLITINDSIIVIEDTTAEINRDAAASSPATSVDETDNESEGYTNIFKPLNKYQHATSSSTPMRNEPNNNTNTRHWARTTRK